MNRKRRTTTAQGAAVILALISSVPSAAMAQSLRPALDHESAMTIQAHCLAKAKAEELAVAIAVYDRGGNLVSFARLDGASAGAGEVARWKGRSAALYLASTAETAAWNAPTAPMLSTVEGGVPLFAEDGTGLGGVGVSGATSAFDAACGAAGAEAAGLTTSRP